MTSSSSGSLLGSSSVPVSSSSALGGGVGVSSSTSLSFFDFLFSDDELVKTPSSLDGIEAEIECRNRAYGCELIADATLLLQLPQVVSARAQVLFHRFYQRRSMFRFDVEVTSMAVTFLSAKMEECPRRPREIIFVFSHLAHERKGDHTDYEMIVPGSDEYDAWKQRLIKRERNVLRELGFVLHVEHPHKYILNYLHVLKSDDLAQEAWNFLNDSLRTNLCLRFPANVIASGAIYLASRKMHHPLPENPPWWTLFDVRFEDLCVVCSTILDAYDAPKAELLPLGIFGPPAPPQTPMITQHSSCVSPSPIIHAHAPNVSSHRLNSLHDVRPMSDVDDGDSGVGSQGLYSNADETFQSKEQEELDLTLRDAGVDPSFGDVPAPGHLQNEALIEKLLREREEYERLHRKSDESEGDDHSVELSLREKVRSTLKTSVENGVSSSSYIVNGETEEEKPANKAHDGSESFSRGDHSHARHRSRSKERDSRGHRHHDRRRSRSRDRHSRDRHRSRDRDRGASPSNHRRRSRSPSYKSRRRS